MTRRPIVSVRVLTLPHIAPDAVRVEVNAEVEGGRAVRVNRVAEQPITS